jgi:hypothetical protein
MNFCILFRYFRDLKLKYEKKIENRKEKKQTDRTEPPKFGPAVPAARERYGPSQPIIQQAAVPLPFSFLFVTRGPCTSSLISSGKCSVARALPMPRFA